MTEVKLKKIRTYIENSILDIYKIRFRFIFIKYEYE